MTEMFRLRKNANTNVNEYDPLAINEAKTNTKNKEITKNKYTTIWRRIPYISSVKYKGAVDKNNKKTVMVFITTKTELDTKVSLCTIKNVDTVFFTTKTAIGMKVNLLMIECTEKALCIGLKGVNLKANKIIIK